MADRLNIRALLARHGLRPKRSFSQNFLVDLRVLDRIAEAAGLDAQTPVVELGAGLGALTAMLARRALRVVAVERDRDMAKVLRSEFAGDPQVEILEANAATLRWEDLLQRLGVRPVVVANLPYHMASPILFSLLRAGSALLSRWILMFQREMAQRLIAGPGSRRYGVLSVLVQARAMVEHVLDVPPTAFYPAPKVHSQVLRFIPLPSPRVEIGDGRAFETVVRAAFGQRRKMLRNGLLSVLGPSLGKDGVERLLAEAGIEGNRRAEELSLQEFARLGNLLGRLQ
jgi:16S rRNA (adenine1518-N6/adenine1519-N6)-dimethyltransferase